MIRDCGTQDPHYGHITALPRAMSFQDDTVMTVKEQIKKHDNFVSTGYDNIFEQNHREQLSH